MDYSKIRANWWSGTCYHKKQLDEIVTSTDVHRYAYILHDKDKQPNSDELKKPHYHFMVHFQQPQRGSWFKAFATDDMGIVFAKRCSIPKAAFDYLIHDTPACRKEGKHLYDSAERITTIENLDDTAEQKEEDEHAELYNDLTDLLGEKITWHDLIKKKPKRIHMIANIKVAYDLLCFEAFGHRYFEKNSLQKPTPHKTQLPPPLPKPPQIAPQQMQVLKLTDKEKAEMPF